MGELKQAITVMDESERYLSQPDHAVMQYHIVRLAVSYADGLRQVSVTMALDRLIRLLERMGFIYDTFTTRNYYSLARLQVVEAILLVVIDLAEEAE